MNAPKIDSAAVDLATNAACNALANDPSLDWITKSCIIERAYFWGLAKGLNAIADEKALDGLLRLVLMRTLWSRNADDTFPTTQLGRSYAVLEEGVRRIESFCEPPEVGALNDA